MKYIMVTGHRPNKVGGYAYPNPIRTWVFNELERILLRAAEAPSAANGVACITGMAIGVDQWFAEVAIRNGIPFLAYIPFKGQESKWPEHSQNTYKDLLTKADNVIICSSGEYAPEKMHIRNHRMVDDSDYMIAVWDGSKGGTYECVHYAMKASMQIYRIDPLAKTVGWMKYPKQMDLFKED